MTDSGDAIAIGDDGSIRPVGSDLEQRLRARAGRYRLVVDTADLLVLRREAERGDGADNARILMAGEIISRMTVIEVMNVIANANWRGQLHVIGNDSHRVLSFDHGALKNARSDASDDRLGEVLYRMGVLSRAQLDELVAELGPEQRFGEVLMNRGIVDRDALFRHLQTQAEQIFYNALLVHTGQYVFRLPGSSEPPPSMTLHIPVQHLLMQGVQRVDEMALFRERIPHSQKCPEVKQGAPQKQLDTTAQTVLAYCDGSRNIEEISRQTGLGEFEATKAVYQLLQQGQVVLRAGSAIDEQAVRKLVIRFNDVMRDIFMAVATYGGIDRTREQLSQWIASHGYAELLGAGVEEDGSFDAAALVETLKRSDSDHPLEALHGALHQLAAYALFCATSSLPRDQELMLARDVNRRLKAIRF